MRIIHFSDPHFSPIFKRNNIKKTKYLLKQIKKLDFDHIIITGDISDNAEIKEFLIFKNLLRNFNLLNSDQITLTIGNHDIFGGVQTPADLLNFPKKCSNVDFNSKIDKFVSMFGELFEGVYFPDERRFFPFAKEIGDVVIVGVNSIDHYSRMTNPFASNGRVSGRQRENLEKIFMKESYSEKIKIVAIHHHFYKKGLEVSTSPNGTWDKIESYTLKLRGKKKIMNLFKEHDVKIVMHGHSHEFLRYQRKGIDFLNAGGSIDNGLKDEVSFFVIEIDDKKHHIEEYSMNYRTESLEYEPERTEYIGELAEHENSPLHIS